MQYFLFLDESGDHGLNKIDPNFPVFVLCGILISKEQYLITRGKMNEVKRRFWDNKKVIFHSRDIRKCQNEFQILFDEQLKKNFYESINSVVKYSNYSIISAAIHKENYVKRYGRISDDVYEVSLSFILERTVFYLDSCSGRSHSLKIIIEKRGNKEDSRLSDYLRKVISRGTGYVVPDRFQNYNFRFSFFNKKENINGLQLADLIAYPTARYVIDTDRANPSFDQFKDKFYSDGTKKYGLKIFP